MKIGEWRSSVRMTNRSQFYIREEMEFGRMDKAHTRGPFLGDIFQFARSIFLGVSMAVMFSGYGLAVLYILDRLDAPLPPQVSQFLSNTEFRVSQTLSQIKESRFNHDIKK